MPKKIAQHKIDNNVFFCKVLTKYHDDDKSLVVQHMSIIILLKASLHYNSLELLNDDKRQHDI